MTRRIFNQDAGVWEDDGMAEAVDGCVEALSDGLATIDNALSDLSEFFRPSVLEPMEAAYDSLEKAVNQWRAGKC